MHRILTLGVGTAALVTAYHLKGNRSGKINAQSESVSSLDNGLAVDEAYKQPLPSRNDLISSLKSPDVEYDVLVIGGGATGTGVALDACTRGLKTALVEKDDYASGTSSKSTKLLHGGVRYLQTAILKLDYDQYKLVKEALAERTTCLKNSPHISKPLPILLPIYTWWKIPYFWVGIKMYDLVAGDKCIHSSYYVNKKKTLELFPTLNAEKLAGALVYYDGQQDDARMNLSVAMSAIRKGAKCVNHVEVVKLLFQEDDDKKRVCGAHVRDILTGDEWNIKAKSVVNAAGPFTDSIRQMNDEHVKKICAPAAGVHLTLPDYYCSKEFGLLDPATSDGRVIFVLPWEGKTIVGTTDRKCDVTFNPEATKEEIDFIMTEIKRYYNTDLQVRKGDILSSWSGIRPLVTDPSSKDTKSISRHHVVEISDTNLVSISGGKWTTYRAMAQDTVDAIVKTCGLKTTSACVTETLLVEGSEGWSETYYVRLMQEYGLEEEVAKHLSHCYGTKAPLVAELASHTGKRWPVIGKRLSHDLPFIEADVLYAMKHEYAQKVIDVISRRMRAAFLNIESCKDIVPRVIDIMADELKWNAERIKVEETEAHNYLQSMNYKHIYEKAGGHVPEQPLVDDVTTTPIEEIPVETENVPSAVPS